MVPTCCQYESDNGSEWRPVWILASAFTLILLLATVVSCACCKKKKKRDQLLPEYKSADQAPPLPSDTSSIERSTSIDTMATMSPSGQKSPVIKSPVIKKPRAMGGKSDEYWAKKAESARSLNMDTWKDKVKYGTSYRMSSAYNPPSKAPSLTFVSTQSAADSEGMSKTLSPRLPEPVGKTPDLGSRRPLKPLKPKTKGRTAKAPDVGSDEAERKTVDNWVKKTKAAPLELEARKSKPSPFESPRRWFPPTSPPPIERGDDLTVFIPPEPGTVPSRSPISKRSSKTPIQHRKSVRLNKTPIVISLREDKHKRGRRYLPKKQMTVAPKPQAAELKSTTASVAKSVGIESRTASVASATSSKSEESKTPSTGAKNANQG